MPSPIKVAILGAGGRGLNAHAHEIINNPQLNAIVTAAVDPKPDRRQLALQTCPDLAPDQVFSDWRDFFTAAKPVDAVVIATMEDLHEPIALAAAQKGLHILLEKPMAPTAQACRNIVNAAKNAGIIFAVCHELRYAAFYQKLKALIDSGSIGDVVHIQHVEDISIEHFTHSFVRGHNRNSDKTSFVLLSKSCHDIDILRFLMNRPCRHVQSFGSLIHFTHAAKPAAAAAATRCTDCAHEPQCPFSAIRIYIKKGVNIGADAMPGESISRKLNPDELLTALRTGPFGKCVYECDNNVADHQTVNLLYDSGPTATFTMSAFTEGDRRTVIHGTRGIIRGELHNAHISRFDFLTGQTHDESITDPNARGGHGGGDEHLMAQFLNAIHTHDPSRLLTGPDETLETHLTTFAAEQSRLENRLISL